MNDTTLDALVRRLAPVTDAAVRDWDLAGAEEALLESLLDVEEPAVADRTVQEAPRRLALLGNGRGRDTISARERRGRREQVSHGPRWVRTGLVAVAASAVLGLVAVAGWAPWRTVTPAYAAEVTTAAEHTPRLLLEASGWRVTEVDQSSTTTGQMSFGRGTASVTVNWYAASLCAAYVKDREDDYVTGRPGASAAIERTGRMLGATAKVFVRGGRAFEALGIVEGGWCLDVQGDLGADAGAQVLGRLRRVSTGAWLDALPSSVFSGDRRELQIDEILRGIPQPTGYDSTALRSRGLVSDRYQLGAAVVSDVGCTWFTQWFAARDQGDAAEQARISSVLRGAGAWPILQWMSTRGGYTHAFVDVAEATRTGAATNLTGNGSQRLTEQIVASSLGCRA